MSLMPRIDIARVNELGAGYATEGWHHHGAHHLHGYIVSGRLQLEYVLEGREIVDLNSGDFFHVPPRLTHRDINPNKDRELLVVNTLVGTGPAVVNVDSPVKGD